MSEITCPTTVARHLHRSFVCNALTGGLSRSPSVLTTTMFEQRRARAAAEAAAVLPPPPLLQHLQVQRKPPPFCCRNPNTVPLSKILTEHFGLLKISRKRGFVWSGEISCHDLVKRPDALRLCRSRRCSPLPGFPAALRPPPSSFPPQKWPGAGNGDRGLEM